MEEARRIVQTAYKSAALDSYPRSYGDSGALQEISPPMGIMTPDRYYDSHKIGLCGGGPRGLDRGREAKGPESSTTRLQEMVSANASRAERGGVTKG
jgi:hypothetical protein